MNLLEGLKIIWSDPEIRKTAIKGVAAVAASGVAGYAVGRALSGKNKHYEGEFPAGTELTILDGNVYQAIPAQRRDELNNLRNNLIDALQGGFNEVKWKEGIEENIQKFIDEVNEDIESDMSSETDHYNRDTREFLRIKEEIEDGKEELSI